jgi:hypothetical protein
MLIWGPIVVGVVHQFFMYFFGIERIYVFVDPPGYVYPWASLEFEWWFVLLLGSAIIGILAYSGKFPRIPSRIAIPFYFYILFLLLLVKPV